ncbi:MAG: response regulator transcription factor [Acidobacteria bacterium]|nr:response regulator transcription factor [Acidobacteriota bacterium]
MRAAPEEAARVLLIEDEENLAAGIRFNLEAEGLDVDWIGDGEVALERIRDPRYQLVILDVMLPGVDGFTLCEEARRHGVDTPVLFLTAKAGVDDRIRGLEAGGDDYLAKPFHLTELLLRVQAILRRRAWRAAETSPDVVRFGDNHFDFSAFAGASWDGKTQQLTQKEAMILKTLAEREGEVVSREDILDRVWGYEAFPSSRTIDNFVLRLRKRFEPDPERPRHFHTVRGVGYRFTAGTD